MKNYGIKDYSLHFSSSEDEKEKTERKQRNKERLAAALRRSLGLQGETIELENESSL